MAFKDFVAEILGIKSYEDKYEKTKQTLENLQRAHETILAANDILARQIIDLEDKIEVLKANPEKYVWERCRDFARTHTEDMEHRAFANGRAAADGELGIWRLAAIARGNCLVRLSNEDDAEIVELITDDLVDVYEKTHSEKVDRRVVLDTAQEPKIDAVAGEIEIDDIEELAKIYYS